MASTSHSPQPVKSLRRFVTIMVCNVRLTDREIAKRGEAAAGAGLDAFWSLVSTQAKAQGGLPLPMQSTTVTVVFGYPHPDKDHAARAIQCANRLLDAACAGQDPWMPPFGVGLFSGDCLFVEQGTKTARTTSITGVGSDGAAALARVARPLEALASESTVQCFREQSPSGLKTIEVFLEDDPDLDGLNWEFVDFIGLPESLRQLAVLAGPEVDHDPQSAHYFFRYLFAAKFVSDRTPVNIAAISAAGGIPSFSLSAPEASAEGELSRLGSYILVRRLGHGGTGQVWLARDFFGSFVAVKALQEAYASDARQIARLQREASAMSSLPHPNICQVREVGVADGLHFIAMEFVNGSALSELLSYPGRLDAGLSLGQMVKAVRDQPGGDRPEGDRQLPFPETLEMFAKVCDAVAFAHDKGILHRDLKPANILLREDGEPVVCDFGLAKVVNSDAGESFSLHGEILGTLEYMAPEQAHDSKAVDERADIYSLGGILYLLLCGKPHFQPEGDILKDAARLQTHEAEPLKKRIPALHPDLALIAWKCLRPVRYERYQTARALRDDIQRFLLGQPVLARPPSVLRSLSSLATRHKAAVTTASVAALILALFSIYTFAQLNRSMRAAIEARNEADRARDLARANEAKAIAALQDAKKNELRAEDAEADKLRLLGEKEQSQEKLLALQRRDRALREVPGMIKAAALPGEDLSDSFEMPADDSPDSTQYFKKVEKELSDLLEKLALVSSNALVAPGVVRHVNWNTPPQSDLVAQFNGRLTQLKLLAPQDPRASLLLAKLGVLMSNAPDPAPLLKAASADPASQAEATALLNALQREKRLSPEAIASSGSERSPRIAPLARYLEQTKKKLPVPGTVPSSMLLDFLRQDAPAANGGRDWLDFRSTGTKWSVVEASGINDTTMPLLAEFALARFKESGTPGKINLSRTSATTVPGPVSGSCWKLTARNSSVVSVEKPPDGLPRRLRHLDLARSRFRDPAALPASPFLEILNINDCPVPEGGFVFAFTGLQQLYARGIPFDSLNEISRLTDLRILRFSPDKVRDKASIEALRRLKRLTHIGTGRHPSLLPVEAFWLLYEAGYFDSTGPDSLNIVLPVVPSQQKAQATPSPTAPLPTAPANSTNSWPRVSTPAPKQTPSPPPQPTPPPSPLDGIIGEIRQIFISPAARSTSPQNSCALLRPKIKVLRDLVESMNASGDNSPEYLLLLAKSDSLVRDGAGTRSRLESAMNRALETNNHALEEEARTLVESLDSSANGEVISPHGLRRTGTPENIRLAVVYEEIAELAARYEEKTGQPFEPSLLRQEKE